MTRILENALYREVKRNFTGSKCGIDYPFRKNSMLYNKTGIKKAGNPPLTIPPNPKLKSIFRIKRCNKFRTHSQKTLPRL